MQDIFSILERRRAIAPNADSLDDELKHYLDAPPIQNVLNPVLWWKDRREIYPNLSRMAIDFLTTPGTFFFFVTHTDLIPADSHLCLQLARLMLNVCSAVAAWFCPTLGTGSACNQLARSCALALGASSVLSRPKMRRRWHRWRTLMVTRTLRWKRDGIVSIPLCSRSRSLYVALLPSPWPVGLNALHSVSLTSLALAHHRTCILSSSPWVVVCALCRCGVSVSRPGPRSCQ